MKTYLKLSKKEKDLAQEAALLKLLNGIVEGCISFEHNKPLHKKVLAAHSEAQRMQTPWFTGEYLMDTCATELRRIALIDAKRAYYREPGDLVLALT